MTVPTPTSEYLDINTATFTDQSAPVDIDDQHNPDAGATFDGVNDYKTTAVTPFTSAGGASNSFSVWIKTPNTETVNTNIMCQLDTGVSNKRAFTLTHLGAGSGGLQIQWRGPTDVIWMNAEIVAGMLDWDDDTWRLITGTVTDTVAKIYIGGVEASSYANQSENGTYTGPPAAPSTLALGGLTNGGGYYAGSLSRPKFWEGTTLSDAQVLEEFNNECAAVVAPTPTTEYLDLSTATFTANGGAVLTDDQHGSDNCYITDGVNDYLSTSVKPFTTGSGLEHSQSTWIKWDNTTSGGMAVNQQLTASNRGFYIISNTTLTVEYGSVGTNILTRAIIAAGMLDWDDGEWHLITSTVNATLVKIYVDGVEATAYTDQTDSGWVGFPASITTLGISAKANGSGNFAACTVSRPKWWLGTELSECEVLAEYNAEFASIGEGFLVGGIQGGLGRPDFRLDMIRQTRYNKGLPRFRR